MRKSALALTILLLVGCSGEPEWVDKAKSAGALIGLEYYSAVLHDALKDRSWAVDCRAYDYKQHHYMLCLPVTTGVGFKAALGMKHLPWVLMEWANGQVWPVNGTTDAALRRYARRKLGLGEDVREFTILETKVRRSFRRDGGPQAYEIIEAIKKKGEEG